MKMQSVKWLAGAMTTAALLSAVATGSRWSWSITTSTTTVTRMWYVEPTPPPPPPPRRLYTHLLPLLRLCMRVRAGRDSGRRRAAAIGWKFVCSSVGNHVWSMDTGPS